MIADVARRDERIRSSVIGMDIWGSSGTSGG